MGDPPLTLILGFAGDLLNSHILKREISHQVQLISENAQRLLRLVNQLMDFRKIEGIRSVNHILCPVVGSPSFVSKDNQWTKVSEVFGRAVIARRCTS